MEEPKLEQKIMAVQTVRKKIEAAPGQWFVERPKFYALWGVQNGLAYKTKTIPAKSVVWVFKSWEYNNDKNTIDETKSKTSFQHKWSWSNPVQEKQQSGLVRGMQKM